MKQYTLTNRAMAALAFLVTLIVYTLTLQPSVPFWDCGEFSAAAAWQQVPHPPGAPLWLIVAKWFHLLPLGDPGWRLNMVSAVSSAFTAALVYLITVKLVERWRPYREGAPASAYWPTFGAGLIAALTLTFSDSQWFNSVESEVYAAGGLLIALLVWLMMRWNEVAGEKGHERYLLMIAYVTGLAFGVHLLALLVIPAVGMVIYFRTRPFKLPSFAIALAIIAVGFYLIVYQFPLQYLPSAFSEWGTGGGIMLILALAGLLWWSVKEKKSVVALSSASVLLIILGFSTYIHIMVRANAHPPMNENEPDTMAELVSYLGRDQYGKAPNWPRRYQTDSYYRSRQDKYGEWYEPTRAAQDGTPIFDEINTGGELNFMWTYQTNHMYLRYLFWNFVGRVSDVQGAGTAAFSATEEEKATFISETGYDDVFPVTFFALPLILGLIGIYYHFRRDWKMGLVYGALFLLLGVLAAWQQNQQEPQPRERDYFYVGSFMVFAIWIGIGAAGLAEQLGFTGRTDERDEEVTADSPAIPSSAKSGVVGAVLAASLLVAPINMAVGGWKFHDRSGNWVPWDYSYNILQSCEKDAIIFTNGDNDTFPLWYLQDVAGVRRDVRVVNLSLGQTSWYIWQLKNERPWGAKQIKLSFPNEILKVPDGERGGLAPQAMPQNTAVSVPLDAAAMRFITKDSSAAASTFSWQMRGGDYGGQPYLGVQHQLVRDIVQNNIANRPIYFSSSTGSEVWCGLENYFRQEGMAFRIYPKSSRGFGQAEMMNADVTWKCLMEPLADDVAYTEPHYGFKFRNLANHDVMFLEDHRRLMINYRMMFIELARYQLTTLKDKTKAIAVLDRLNSTIAPNMFGMPYPLAAEIANLYAEAGARDKAAKFADLAIKLMDDMGMNNRYAQSYPPEQLRPQMLAAKGDYDAAIKVYEGILPSVKGTPNEYVVRAYIEQFRMQRFLAKGDTAGAVASLRESIASYGADSSQGARTNIQGYNDQIRELLHEGPHDPTTQDNTSTADTALPAATSVRGSGDSADRDLNQRAPARAR